MSAGSFNRYVRTPSELQLDDLALTGATEQKAELVGAKRERVADVETRRRLHGATVESRRSARGPPWSFDRHSRLSVRADDRGEFALVSGAELPGRARRRGQLTGRANGRRRRSLPGRAPGSTARSTAPPRRAQRGCARDDRGAAALHRPGHLSRRRSGRDAGRRLGAARGRDRRGAHQPRRLVARARPAPDEVRLVAGGRGSPRPSTSAPRAGCSARARRSSESVGSATT